MGITDCKPHVCKSESCGPTDNRNVFSCPEPGDSDADDPHEPLCFKNLRLGCDSDADGAKDEL